MAQSVLDNLAHAPMVISDKDKVQKCTGTGRCKLRYVALPWQWQFVLLCRLFPLFQWENTAE